MSCRILLLAVLFFTASCSRNKDVSVNLSLHMTDYERGYYIKAEIANHTPDDIYIPYLRDFISVYRNGADITQFASNRSEYDHDKYGYSQDEIDGILNLKLPDTLIFHGRNMEYIYTESLKQEFADFCQKNSIDTLGMSQEEKQRLLDEIGGDNIFAKYDGITLKAGEKQEIFQPVHMLFCNGRPRGEFEVKFVRHLYFESALYDTVKTLNGNLFFCGLPDKIGEYKLYRGTPKCKNSVIIKSK